MKRGKYLFFLFTLCGLFQSCNIPELPGSIYGTVEDKATGEPIKSAWVELSDGKKITTGSNGAFEFPNLNPNEYTMFVTKNGYVDSETYHIDVKPNQSVKVDIQIERLPPALKVIDDNRTDIDTLDFGNAEDDVARSFNIFNDGVDTLEWQITKTAEWIKSISKTEGKLAAGATQSIVVVIDRTKLGFGENRTTLHITSNSGSKQLTIMVTGQIVTILNTLPVTYLNSTSVTLSGEILEDGNPKYTERGFVYSELSMPTVKDCIKKINLPITNNKQYSTTLDNLITNRTYYARAYAVQKGNEVYSTNEVVFVPKNSLGKVETTDVTRYSASLVEFEGNIIEVGEPIYTECGFVYGTNSNPTIDNSKKTIAPYTGKTGIYSMHITDPDLDVLSYVRAYIINDGEPSYGKSLTFRVNSEPPGVKKPTITEISPENRQATFNSYITNLGSPAYTEVGFVYNTSSNPTLEKIIVNTNGGQGNYHITVSDLTVNTTYYVRAFITNEVGTYYSDETTFNLKLERLPNVTTISAEILDNTSVYLVGNITDAGEPAYTERGFLYSKVKDPTFDASDITKIVVNQTSLAQFEKQVVIDGLAQNIFYIRAYAKNSAGTAYGNVLRLEHPDVIAYTSLPMFKYSESTYRVYPEFESSTYTDWYRAIDLCDKLEYLGHSDWIVPSKEELNQMCVYHQEEIGLLDYTYYWSSTSDDNNDTKAWLHFSTSNYQQLESKDVSYYAYQKPGGFKIYRFRVRCIRKEN